MLSADGTGDDSTVERRLAALEKLLVHDAAKRSQATAEVECDDIDDADAPPAAAAAAADTSLPGRDSSDAATARIKRPVRFWTRAMLLAALVESGGDPKGAAVKLLPKRGDGNAAARRRRRRRRRRRTRRKQRARVAEEEDVVAVVDVDEDGVANDEGQEDVGEDEDGYDSLSERAAEEAANQMSAENYRSEMTFVAGVLNLEAMLAEHNKHRALAEL